jgi:hypothetical protein
VSLEKLKIKNYARRSCLRKEVPLNEPTDMPRTAGSFSRSQFNQGLALESRSVRHHVSGRRCSIPNRWWGRGPGRSAEVSAHFRVGLDRRITTVGAIRHGIPREPYRRCRRLLAPKRRDSDWRCSSRQRTGLSPAGSRIPRAWRNLSGRPHGSSRWTQLPLEVRQLLQSCRQRPTASLDNHRADTTPSTPQPNGHSSYDFPDVAGHNHFKKGKNQNDDH